MKEHYDNEEFARYLDGTMTEEETVNFKKALKDNSLLLESFQEYEELRAIEETLQQQNFSPGPHFAERVMEHLPYQQSSFKVVWSRCMDAVQRKRFFAGVGSVAVVCLCLFMITQHSADEFQLNHSDVSRPGKEQGRDGQQMPSTNEELNSTSGISPDATSIYAENIKTSSKSNEIKSQQSSKVGKRIREAVPVDPRKFRDAVEKQLVNNPASSRTAHFKAGDPHGLVQKSDVRERRPEYLLSDKDVSHGISAPLSPPLPTTPENYRQNLYHREGYSEYEESPRVKTTHESVSTFSIDVDSGSYSNVRRLINSGITPPKGSVRIEEFLNYFSYKLPDTKMGPFQLGYEIAPSPFHNGRHLLKLHVATEHEEEERLPWNLVFLVDVSGSMTGTGKLQLVKQALHILADQMNESDRLSIVTYASGSRVVLEGAHVGEREKIQATINSLSAGGGTNGHGGITLAYRIAKKSMIEDGVNRVILATDGDFNLGVTSDKKLIDTIKRWRSSGVTLTTIGVGSGNYQETKMEQLANQGQGNYFYLDTLSEARKVFKDCLVATMQVKAKDVKLQVEFNPSRVTEYRLIGYDNRTLRNPDFINDNIDAGEIGQGHSVTAFYEVTLVGSPVALEQQKRYAAPHDLLEDKTPTFSDELAFLKIRYKQPKGDTSIPLSMPIRVSDKLGLFEDASDDFRFAAAVIGFGSLLRQSDYQGNVSFASIIEIAKETLSSEYLQRSQFIELVENAASLDRIKN